MPSDQRREPSYPFVAAAELIEVQSQASFKTQTSDMSLHGCYLDMIVPLPVETQISVRITHQDATFEALGKVAFSQPSMGMEVTFTAIEPDSQALLQKWIRELTAA